MGTLYIVSTPIGNLKDISLRAIDILKSVDLVLCEDTRVSGRLLAHFEISKKLIAINDFNEASRIGESVLNLKMGKNLALISDAGTPLVSDPGYKLIREAIANNIRVEAIPGATAAIVALTISGLPPDKFFFVGYLSKKEGKRKNQLEDIKRVKEVSANTTIIYESPFRVVKTLENIRDMYGDVDIAVCRELTKLHEETRREKVSESIAYFTVHAPKGEFIILI